MRSLARKINTNTIQLTTQCMTSTHIKHMYELFIRRFRMYARGTILRKSKKTLVTFSRLNLDPYFMNICTVYCFN